MTSRRCAPACAAAYGYYYLAVYYNIAVVYDTVALNRDLCECTPRGEYTRIIDGLFVCLLFSKKNSRSVHAPTYTMDTRRFHCVKDPTRARVPNTVKYMTVRYCIIRSTIHYSVARTLSAVFVHSVRQRFHKVKRKKDYDRKKKKIRVCPKHGRQ